MKSKKWFSLSIGALVLAAALPATQALAQTKGGTLNMIVQPEPPVIVTAINQQGPTQFVAGKIYESLLTYSTDLKPQPGLAKSWDASADGLTYTFHLQDNVKWHDGKPFTSEDVVFSLADMLPKTHARARVILNKFVESVQAPDAKTVVVKLKTPFPAFMLMFEPGFAPMMPKHLYAGTDYMTNPANQKPVGTGPFMFKEWKRGEYIKLTRNPDYWKPGKPYLDELVFNIIPDSASRAVAFERGSVDVLRGGDVDNVDIKRLRALPKVEYTTAGWEMFSPQAYLIFNMRKPPFDNLKVRQAVMAAINRNMVVNNIFFGLGKVSTSPFVTTEMFYDKNMPPLTYDMKKARALIKESGIKPEDYTIRQLSFPYGSTWDRLGEYTKQALEQLGFKVNLEATDAGGWASRTGNWDFDMTTTFTYQYGDPALGVQRLYISSNIVKGSPFANVQGYSNPETDKQWEAAASEVDPAKRQELYTKLQTTLVNEIANGFLVDMEFPTLYRGNVKNLVKTAIGLNETFDDVYIEK
ncbi:ABC transporter substrate-binding protein [Achromobacter insolitus]|uniref:ABC transporter substrate-binding protein n=1 Tax=Achromobacter TaxID=222 RepID=UPI0007C27D26|nr:MULTISPECIES: ABC transporter substrate-binding protein [Achromobacter]GLK94222.1 solute-binding transporter (periplasmic) [Achromobacter xylosoxidans]MCP1404187.1 peptide/nickel transport system substrate-binding protein [Achromobacter insolitus]MDH3065498.1 ABC transporter substrate-binding protein [Achromobacter insolitus]MEB3099706.1 ABC transporter substrate-binding protein [Achromobacter sp. D10]OAD16279.1 peptide ABC transporter substrate-binding protein [Achromobacter insolitus]